MRLKKPPFLAILGVGALGLLSLSACATSTPYTAAEKGGYGFSEQKIENSRYRITFRGNSSTPRETVENYLLYRAAELTRQKGYDYFVVVTDDTEKTTTYRTTPGSPFYGPHYYGYGRAFPYYGYGWRWSDLDGPEIRTSTRYSAIAYIKMYKGTKPDAPAAYDAQQVLENLRPLIQRPQ